MCSSNILEYYELKNVEIMSNWLSIQIYVYIWTYSTLLIITQLLRNPKVDQLCSKWHTILSLNATSTRKYLYWWIFFHLWIYVHLWTYIFICLSLYEHIFIYEYIMFSCFMYMLRKFEVMFIYEHMLIYEHMFIYEGMLILMWIWCY